TANSPGDQGDLARKSCHLNLRVTLCQTQQWPHPGRSSGDSLVRFGFRTGKKMKYMLHARNYFQANIHMGSLGQVIKTLAVIEQYFVATHLDQHRWQAC